MDRLADFRSVFARAVMARAGLTDPPLLRAFSEVPRHEFIGASPWYFNEHGPAVISDDPAILYQDVSMGLAPERGITTGLPSLHARSMAACELKPGESVIQVGAGSGYFSAILAELVGESGSVVAFEIDNSLAKAAERNLKRWKQVRIEATSGVSGISGSADVVYVTSLQPNGYCPGNDRFRDVFRVFAKNRGRKNCVISSCARWLRPNFCTGRDVENRSRIGNPDTKSGIFVFDLARQLQRAGIEIDAMARRTIKPLRKRMTKRRGGRRIQREIAILQATISLLQERLRVLKTKRSARGSRG